MAELVARIARDQDRAAFERLFDHFAPRLNAYLHRLGADSGTSEELAQDAMATLWHKAALFDPAKSSLATWLYRVARNRRIDGLRRERGGPVAADEAMLLPSEPPDPFVVLDARAREEKVRLALSSLPAAQVELVQFAFFEGLSHSEIAARTALPLGTVKSRLRLAFTRLRRALEASGVVDAG
jgi:RNA polymerase sigma-70 factor, ECF subfamily